MTERNQIELTPEYLRTLLLHRRNDSHKGDYGHLLIVAGCQTMPGAAVLVTGAALKSGCGLVTLHRPLFCQLNMILCTLNQLLSFFG